MPECSNGIGRTFSIWDDYKRTGCSLCHKTMMDRQAVKSGEEERLWTPVLTFPPPSRCTPAQLAEPPTAVKGIFPATAGKDLLNSQRGFFQQPFYLLQSYPVPDNGGALSRTGHDITGQRVRTYTAASGHYRQTPVRSRIRLNGGTQFFQTPPCSETGRALGQLVPHQNQPFQLQGTEKKYPGSADPVLCLMKALHQSDETAECLYLHDGRLCAQLCCE